MRVFDLRRLARFLAEQENPSSIFDGHSARWWADHSEEIEKRAEEIFIEITRDDAE